MEGAVGLAEPVDLERRLEGLNLRAEAVALDGDGDAPEELLPAALRPCDGAREEDGPRARAPHRLRLQELAQRLEQAREAGEQRDRRRFYARAKGVA